MSASRLSSLRPGSALREALAEGYTRQVFVRDLMAAITVGILAVPLAMALAIASGVPPQHGLYTVMIGGLIAPLFGGSRFSVSGPTAAFVLLLLPVSQQFGVAGLAVCALIAGVALVAMALARVGRVIQYIPESVVLGFTGGIGIVIATLQVPDLLGLPLHELPESWPGKVWQLLTHLPALHGPTALVGLGTLIVLLRWRRLNTPVPAALAAVVFGALLAAALNAAGMPVDTVGTRFSWTLPDGTQGHGIPPVLPSLDWPWNLPGADGEPVAWGLDAWRVLVPAGLAIAMLGAIESLLCAMVLDGMTGRRHSANSELFGQGLANIAVPFFGGIPVTAAIARSATNLRSGAVTPLAAAMHALVLTLAVVTGAEWLSALPMASMAALLLVVAWNMSEAPKAVRLMRSAPVTDGVVLLLCLLLTVLVDMVLAIGVGVVAAALLFMREVAAMTRVRDISANRKRVPEPLPPGWKVLEVSGPLFFAAADRVFDEIAHEADSAEGLVLYLDGVPLLDGGGLNALLRFVERCRRRRCRLIIADLQMQPLRTLHRAGVQPIPGELQFTPTLAAALEQVSGAAAS